MTKRPLRPRLIGGEANPNAHNFFYRLVVNQRFLAIIGLVFLLIILFPLAQTYSQRLLVEKQISDVQNQINDYETQNQQLQSLLTYLQSDQSLEQQARLNLNLKKPGEEVVVVENGQPNPEAGPASSAGSVSNLAKWWAYFFD